MKTWLISVCMRSERSEYEYSDMISERIVTELGEHYRLACFNIEIKSFVIPYVGQVLYLYFTTNAQSEQEAIDFIGGWATEMYCRPPELLHSINCLGEYSPELLQQAMQG